MTTPRGGIRGEVGGTEVGTSLRARSDLDQLCARLYARPALLDRPPVDYADSAAWITRDGETVLVNLRALREAA